MPAIDGARLADLAAACGDYTWGLGFCGIELLVAEVGHHHAICRDPVLAFADADEVNIAAEAELIAVCHPRAMREAGEQLVGLERENERLSAVVQLAVEILDPPQIAELLAVCDPEQAAIVRAVAQPRLPIGSDR